MTNDKVVIYTTKKMYEAEIIKQILSDNGIISFIMNKMDYAYQFGEIEILVQRDDVMRSKLLIQEYENQ